VDDDYDKDEDDDKTAKKRRTKTQRQSLCHAVILSSFLSYRTCSSFMHGTSVEPNQERRISLGFC
jgi:hypothetical protein